jgi:hypothetical protein
MTDRYFPEFEQPHGLVEWMMTLNRLQQHNPP